MSAALKATLFVDATTRAECTLHTEPVEHPPYLFVDILSHDELTASLQIWGYEPAAFRRLAAAFTEAATTLEAARQPAVTL